MSDATVTGSTTNNDGESIAMVPVARQRIAGLIVGALALAGAAPIIAHASTASAADEPAATSEPTPAGSVSGEPFPAAIMQPE